MNDQPDPKTGPVKPAQNDGACVTPSPTDAGASAANDPNAPKKLSPEEQMAAFEDALKEADWGHQPC